MLEWLKSGEGVLGFAISLYTLYSFFESRIKERRQRYVLLKQITSELQYFIGMAMSLGSRAKQVETLYEKYSSGPGFPSPAQDADTLPPEAQPASLWLVARAKHLADFQIVMDVEKIGAILDRRQADALFDLLESRRVYVSVLLVRAMDLEAFPRRPGVLKRFVAVAVVNAEPMRDKLGAFAGTLSLRPPEATPNAEPVGPG